MQTCVVQLSAATAEPAQLQNLVLAEKLCHLRRTILAIEAPPPFSRGSCIVHISKAPPPPQNAAAPPVTPSGVRHHQSLLSAHLLYIRIVSHVLLVKSEWIPKAVGVA